uniref:non-specific serine/threonine protein kinase n=2 Tax=Trichobilharzia regenti TaxID=157069 RepID=A0AA85JCK6_TRIRE|nr:unnamed protein product [Trichobilharzia regenti]
MNFEHRDLHLGNVLVKESPVSRARNPSLSSKTSSSSSYPFPSGSVSSSSTSPKSYCKYCSHLEGVDEESDKENKEHFIIEKVNNYEYVEFRLNNQMIRVPKCGITAYLIDFTLSRLEQDGGFVYVDLSSDTTLFQSKGDYQFDIYRRMKSHNRETQQRCYSQENILKRRCMLNDTNWELFNEHTLDDTISNLTDYPKFCLDICCPKQILSKRMTVSLPLISKSFEEKLYKTKNKSGLRKINIQIKSEIKRLNNIYDQTILSCKSSENIWKLFREIIGSGQRALDKQQTKHEIQRTTSRKRCTDRPVGTPQSRSEEFFSPLREPPRFLLPVGSVLGPSQPH